MSERYQVEMQQRIDAARAFSRERAEAPCRISWQDYADLLWAAVEVRSTKGAEGRHRGLRLKELAEHLRTALDATGVTKPDSLHLPDKV